MRARRRAVDPARVRNLLVKAKHWPQHAASPKGVRFRFLCGRADVDVTSWEPSEIAGFLPATAMPYPSGRHIMSGDDPAQLGYGRDRQRHVQVA